MIRVLALVTYRIYPTLMGGQKGVALFYQHLQKHLQVVLALSENNEVPDDLIFSTTKHLHSNKLIFLNYFRIGVLKKLIAEQKIQLIIAEHSYTAWIAFVIKKQACIPFIIHSHNLEALRFKHMHRWWWKVYERYEKWIHQKADYNFFISDEDKSYAIQRFHLPALKCETVTYGVEAYSPKQSNTKKEFLVSTSLNDSYKILFFNGTLDYEPNYEAIQFIITEIAPRLKRSGQHFKILISGNRAAPKLKQTISAQPDLLYLDYVPDVNTVYQVAGLFINPILNSTGIKTKVIEAIANQCTVVSTESGASGIFKEVCGSKLLTVPDGDWDGFVDCIIKQVQKPITQTPKSFFDFYLWDAIAQKAATKINNVMQQHATN